MSYNGWTNYETWRINLEFFDCWENGRLTAESAEEIVTEYLESECSEGIVLDYALAFIARVNWHEIAEAHNEDLEDEDEDEGEDDEF